MSRGLRWFAESEAAAIAFDGADFRAGGVRGHYDVGWHTTESRGASNSGGMVAGRMGGHTALSGRVVEGKHRVDRPSRLECADLLEVLALEKQIRNRRRIEARARQHRGVMN